MSAATRTALSAAVNAVTGINCTPYFRQSTKAGDAMVRLDRHTRSSNGFGFMATWQVLMVLPQDIVTAEKYLDSKVTELVDALSSELIVTTVVPQELVLDNGVRIPVVVIEGSRETD